MSQRILIADDEPLYLRTTGDLLRRAGYDCTCVSDAYQAIEKLDRESFDLVLSDLNMPGNLKLELLHRHSKSNRETPLIVITGVPSLPSAIESIRLGITDYLLKPVKFEDLLASVRRALARPAITRTAPIAKRDESEWNTVFPSIIGRSPKMLEVFEIIDRVATTDTNVLITGESGTGKEVVAKTIHSHSHRRDGAFQVIDCTAVPESLFESLLFGHKKGSFTGAINDQPGLLKQCDGGTAFFDELGELPLPLQSKLLRAVQEQTFTPVGGHVPVKVNTRFICATNRDLQLEVNAGRFRKDLFYRLGVIHIDLPPLRDRGEDVVLLSHFFLDKLLPPGSPIQGFTPQAIAALRGYGWPGNIRELRNVIERTIALVSGDRIDVDDLPETVRKANRVAATDDPATARGHTRSPDRRYPESRVDRSPSLDRPTRVDLPPRIAHTSLSRDEAVKAAEYEYLIGLLDQHGGNVSEAARQAGLSRQGLHKLLKTHEIRAADFR
jgi:DNA-binding NtrC family response regulator